MLDLEAIQQYTTGVLRAREEYFWHPLEKSCPANHKCPNKSAHVKYVDAEYRKRRKAQAEARGESPRTPAQSRLEAISRPPK